MARQVIPSKTAALDPDAPLPEPSAVPELVELAVTADGKFDPDSLNHRKYRVIKGQFGLWNVVNRHGKPDVFTHKTFRDATPIFPTIPMDADPFVKHQYDNQVKRIKAQINPDTYHRDLINRALAIGVIQHAPDDEPTPLPMGILSSSAAGGGDNAVILESINEEMERRRAYKDLRKEIESNAETAQKHADILQRELETANA